ncbi:MAG: signal peptide peptidase SppA [Bacillota bacterium]
MEINTKKIFLGFLAISLLFLIFLGVAGVFIIGKSFNAIENRPKGKDNIAVINITGPIIAAGNSGMLGDDVASSRDIMKQIKRAKESKSVKALLLRVNTPGGSSAASDSIYRELKKFKSTDKPIIVSMGDVAASGGYYVSAAADEIFANPSTITGSIGVIMKFNNLQDLYDKIGVDSITIKSGPHKDIGSPDRKMTTEEKEMLENMVDSVYQQFIDAVVEGRGMKEEKVLGLADGRIYNGAKAQELGLVDQLGTFYDAVDRTAKLANIKGEPNLIYYNQVSPIERLLGSVNKLTTKVLFKQILNKDLDVDSKSSQLMYQQLIEHQEKNNLDNLKLQY